jgi:hypothetical protein
MIVYLENLGDWAMLFSFLSFSYQQDFAIQEFGETLCIALHAWLLQQV